MEGKKNNIVDVCEIRKSFSDVRSKIDELQRSIFSAEQAFIKKHCELYECYTSLLEEQLK